MDLSIGLGWKLQLYHVTMALKQEINNLFRSKIRKAEKRKAGQKNSSFHNLPPILLISPPIHVIISKVTLKNYGDDRQKTRGGVW